MAVKFLAPFVIHPEVALYFGPHCWKKNAWAIRVNHKVPGSYPYPVFFSRVTCRNCLYGGRWGSGIGNCSPFFHLTLIFPELFIWMLSIRNQIFCSREELLKYILSFIYNNVCMFCGNVWWWRPRASPDFNWTVVCCSAETESLLGSIVVKSAKGRNRQRSANVVLN